MALRIVIAVALLIVAIFIFAATKPNTIRVQRSIYIRASPDRIFALINDFHNWPSWAPQDKEDSTMRRTFDGAAQGEGATSDWTSSGPAGRGRMEIIKSTSPSNISVKVDFIKPFKAHNINNFTIEPDGELTKVAWTMEGTSLYVMKVMSIFVNMDNMAGKHFETGLSNMKAAAENHR